MPLNFIITDAGRAAIAQVGGAIGPVTLTKIAIGSAGYTPTANRTALQTEIKRIDPSGSSVPVPGTISITAQDNSADSYSVKEIGLYTNNNVLFAIYSQTGVILTKGSGSAALIAMDFVMTNVPPGTVTVGNVGFTYSQATETAMGVLGIATTAEAQAGTIDTKIMTPLKMAQVTATESRRGVIQLANTTEAQALSPDATKALTVARLVDRTASTSRVGVVKLASSAETQTGTDATLAVTPAGLSSRTATDTRAGIVELATNTETQTGTDATLAVTPAGLSSRTATDTRAGIVELATNTETQTGTDATRAVTPASLASASALFVPPGAVLPFAMSTAPTGWLKCNGGEYLKTDTRYAALFAAIGIIYGQTNGSGGTGTSHFRVPDLRGEFIRGWDDARAVDTARGFGSEQADAFKKHKHTTSGELPTNNSSIGYKLPASKVKVISGTGSSEVFSAVLDGSVIYHSHTISDEGGTETRPRNIALLYAIKT